MFKVAWFARFPQGMPKPEARRHWAQRHAPMCIATPGIEQYVQNHVAGPLPDRTGEATEFDGFSCGWWADADAFAASMDTDEWRALVADGDNVFDMAWLEGMSAEVREHVVVDGEPGPYKVVWVARFREDLTPEEARAHWSGTHGPIIAELPAIDRYVQNHAFAAVGGGGEARDPLRFDGFSEAWFADEAAYLEAIGSPQWAQLHEDAFDVFDMTQMWGAVLDERVVKQGAPEIVGTTAQRAG
jgi:uncharacterized protein (TIGR02118 family)